MCELVFRGILIRDQFHPVNWNGTQTVKGLSKELAVENEWGDHPKSEIIIPKVSVIHIPRRSPQNRVVYQRKSLLS